jgi:hypothetical protein
MRLIALVFALSIAAIAGTDTTECKKKSAEECPRKKEHCPKKSS